MKSITLANQEPERLDKVLADALTISRSKIQKAIKDGAVLVDGEPATTKLLVNLENKVEVDMTYFEITPHGLEAPDLNVLFENDDVLVINKPAGLLVHATDTSNEPTLVDALVKHDASIEEVGDDPKRAGLVHRLDKQASGVLIVAKTNEALADLKAQFKARTTTKHYTVLVRGKMRDAHGTIELPISRAKSTGRMAAKPASQGGKEAITHFDVLEAFPHHTLCDVRIETGRTHQIRAHFFAIGHQVAGDTLYQQKGLKPMNLGRLFLHARELTVTLPGGEEKTFTSPLPQELEDVLKNIPRV